MSQQPTIQNADLGTYLLASATKTATGTGDATKVRRPAVGLVASLDVTAAATGGSDTLDVVIQTRLGGQWVDVIAFTQVLGNGGAKVHVAKLSGTEPQAMFATSTALTAGNVRHVLGDEWRCKWTVGGTGSFTFSVAVLPVG